MQKPNHANLVQCYDQRMIQIFKWTKANLDLLGFKFMSLAEKEAAGGTDPQWKI